MATSCVVPSADGFLGRAPLSHTLRRIANLQPGDALEVVVVAIDDDTYRKAAAWKPEGAISEIRAVQYPLRFDRSGARNFGARAASGDLLWFLDDDTLPQTDDILSKARARVRSGTYACGARRFWTPIGWNSDWLSDAMSQGDILDRCMLPAGIDRESGFRDLQEFSFVGNCGFFVRDDFFKIGEFNSVNFPSRREDVELMYRLALEDFRFENLFDEVAVLHLNHPAKLQRPNERGDYHQRFARLEAKIGLRFKVNHLLGVFESDGTKVLESVAQGETRPDVEQQA